MSRKGASGGYHGDLSIPGYKPKTPTVKPSAKQASKGPAGTYAGAKKAYNTAVVALPPEAQAVTEAATTRATKKRATRAQTATKRKNRAILRATSSKPEKASPLKDLAEKASAIANEVEKAGKTATKAVVGVEKAIAQPKAKKLSSYLGTPTLGTPTYGSLLKGTKARTLKKNEAGKLTTPQTRKAARAVRKAKRKVARSQPRVAGLSPEEAETVKYVRKAHRKYPDVPASVLMSLTRQESGFNPAAVSSAAAQGLTQFIPSTASSYGVRYGTGKREKQSQETGAAKLLHDSGFATDQKGALTAYTGGYSDAEYNNPVLQGAADYKALDRHGNPKARKQLVEAKAQAAKLGIPAGGGKGAKEIKVGPPPKKVVKKYKQALVTMKQIDSKGYEYQWGGGHGSVAGEPVGGPGTGYDCSGAISAMLHSVGALDAPLTSGNMGAALEPGEGAITVFYNGVHTFAYIPARKEYWGTSTTNPGGGAGFFDKATGDSEVASGNSGGAYSVGHVPGLGKKQALQMGITGVSGTSSSTPFPGMTVSPSGTSATIEPGAGTQQAKPGFSKRPISVAQQVARTTNKLKALGVGDSQSTSTGTSIAALEKKYGVRAV